MFAQTIALFRFQLLGIINVRILVVLMIISVLAFVSSLFVAELAIINSDTVALGFLAEFFRYSLVMVLVVSLSYQISQDYELRQFEHLLAMPVSRGQYVVAELLVLMTFSLFLIIPMFIIMNWMGEFSVALYWALAVFLELLLVGQFTVLAILSLEKLPLAVIFTFAVYLLAKVVPFIDLILSQSSPFYQEETGFQFMNQVFSLIQYVLPDLSAFAQNNLIFESIDWLGTLLTQLLTVAIYGCFIQFIILIDFYRKEFNQS